MRLRVAVWHNLPSGGGKRALHDQVRGLLARGHEVEAWCPPTADRAFLPLAELVPEHVVELEEPAAPRLAIGARHARARRLGARLGAMDRHARSCAERIEAGGFDVLLAHPCREFRVPAVGRHARLPSLLYLQEPNRTLYEASPALPWEAPPPAVGRNPLRRWAVAADELAGVQGLRAQVREERAWASAFGGLLVNSFYSRESVLRAYGLDSAVCYLGVDVDAFRPSGAAKEAYVAGLGALHPSKRVGLAIEAVGRIEASRRPRLVWVANFADDEYGRAMAGLAGRLGVGFEARVRVPDAEVVDVLGRAACLVYTSHLEPFGYAPLEANACGTAVVAVAEGGVRETVREGVNGMLVERCDATALAAAIGRLTGDLDRAEELGRSARRHVEEAWGPGPALDRLEGFLLEAAGRGGRGLARRTVAREEHSCP